MTQSTPADLLFHTLGSRSVDYLHNMNVSETISSSYLLEPGDSYEAPVYTAKQTYQSAISTMQANHPNDWFTTICYSWPRSGSNGNALSSSGWGRFNCVRSPLGPNYSYATASLFFPFSTINTDGSCNNTEVTPYDSDPATSRVPSANFMDVPRPDGNTCFAMALMLAYNQFATTSPNDTTLRSFVSSSPITFPTGMAGGWAARAPRRSSSSRRTVWPTPPPPPPWSARGLTSTTRSATT